jgi:hypothetical protein
VTANLSFFLLKIMEKLRSSIDSFRIQPKPPTLYERFPMPSRRPNPPSCLVKNENGIYTVRKSSEFLNNIQPMPRPQPSFYSSNLVYESVMNRQPPPQYFYGNPLQLRDREIDVSFHQSHEFPSIDFPFPQPYGCWKPPQPSPFNFPKPSGF